MMITISKTAIFLALVDWHFTLGESPRWPHEMVPLSNGDNIGVRFTKEDWDDYQWNPVDKTVLDHNKSGHLEGVVDEHEGVIVKPSWGFIVDICGKAEAKNIKTAVDYYREKQLLKVASTTDMLDLTMEVLKAAVEYGPFSEWPMEAQTLKYRFDAIYARTNEINRCADRFCDSGILPDDIAEDRHWA